MKQYFTCFFLLTTTFCFSQDNIRYSTPIFKDYNIYENIIYSEAIPYSIDGEEVLETYTFDFYEPANDIATNRPLVLLFPDGDFIVGNKEQDEIVNWCKELVTYGYTCACVNYRQGYDASHPDGINRAMYRGVQDARAAIRYITEYQRTFKVNTDKIYLGGYKSGAVIALHTAFLDKEEERPRATFAYKLEKDLNCLDCSGNPFEHKISIAGVLNVDGAIYNPKIIANNADVEVLNFHIESENFELKGERFKHLIGVDMSEKFSSKYDSNFLHHFLDSLNFDSQYEELKIDTGTVGFATSDYKTKTMAVVGFLNDNLKFKTAMPSGKSKTCENTTTIVSLPFEEHCEYEWFVEKGTLEFQSLNTAEIKWNKGSGIGKVSVIKTDETGVRGMMSEALIVKITPQPIADFEIEYLSDNAIKMKDKSLDANLFSIDFGFEGEMYQGKPNTNASFTYKESGTYFLTQTVENICGLATQSIPVEINLSNLYRSANIAEATKEIPSLIQKGNNIYLNGAKLNNIKELSVVIKDGADLGIVEATYNVTSLKSDFLINTAILEKGIYFMEFLSDKNILMTKKIRVR